jgi:hypothetical protein
MNRVCIRSTRCHGISDDFAKSAFGDGQDTFCLVSDHLITIYEESLLAKKLCTVSLRGSNSHWLLWRPYCMKLPGPLLSLLRRLMVFSLLLRVRRLVLPSDCVDADELLRLRVFWLDIVSGFGW